MVVVSKEKMLGERKCISVYLTEELVMEILLRLPVKAVMRFKCVCKSWNSLINSSSFIAAKQLLLRRDYPVIIITGVCDDYEVGSRTVCETRIISYDTLVAHGVFDNRRNPSLSLTHPPPRPRLLGYDNRWTEIYCFSCCDGVLFIKYPISKEEDSFPVRYEYALWNPATGDSKAFPIDRDRFECLERYGFVDNYGCGFDSKNNQYRPFLVRSDRRLYSIEIEIYSFITNKWKLIEFSGVISHQYQEEVVYANEICHWVGFSSLAERNAIVSFDMTNEVILTTPFPDDYTYNTVDDSCEPCYRPYLLLFNDSLALVKRLNIDTLEVVDLDYDDRFEVAPHIDDADRYEVAGAASFDVWVLGEYGNKDSWTKLFTIGPLPGIEKVVGFWNETKILVTDGDCQLFLYDTVTPQALKLQMIGPGSNVCLGVFTCRQSLCPIVDPLLLKSVPKNTKVKERERVRVLSLNKKRQFEIRTQKKKMKTKISDGNDNPFVMMKKFLPLAMTTPLL